MNEKSKAPVTAIFLGFIFLFFVANLLIPDRDFSERENRYLQTKPNFSFTRLFSGDYTEDFENFIADQFPLRDQWITLNARYSQLCGKKESNGIYLCEDDRLLEPFESTTDFSIQSRIDILNSFAAQTPARVTLGLIPGAAEIYRDLLPEGAPADSQTEFIDTVYASADTACVNIATALDHHRDEYIFYRTDHHWTSLGAYYAYETLGASLGYEPRSLAEFEREVVSDNFYGTAYSSSGYTWVAPDSIERFVDAPPALSVFNYDSGDAVAGSLYHPAQLAVKDQYSYFLGGNTPLLTLVNEEAPTSSLLILRDSYSDCLAPFLLEHFREIHMMDLRYYKDSVLSYIEENAIEQVLILYSVENFSNDKGILMLDA